VSPSKAGALVMRARLLSGLFSTNRFFRFATGGA
jgi:hypothetical protein